MVKFLDLQKVNGSFEPELSNAVQQVIASGWYLRGKSTAIFEEHFAAYCHRATCIGVANGLDALTLALMARKHQEGWGNDAEVIVPAMTFVATAQAVVRAGLRPVFVDVDDNALLDSRLLEQAITIKTRAIIPVHLYGQRVDMSRIAEIAAAHQLFILEDAAQAHGIVGKGPGHALAFSFYPGKNLGALGDAGAVVTDDLELAKTIRAMANYGSQTKYFHEMEGCNSRIDEVQSAILDVKLKRLDTDNKRRCAIAALYDDAFRRIAERVNGFRILALSSGSVYHIYPVFCTERDVLQKVLAQKGIETLIHYPIPLHQQPCLSRFVPASQSFPQAERIAKTALSLPISPVMSDDDVLQVISAIQQHYML